jgi:peptidoglycan/xylan/chitin deacetylase (PgdA/CDA1 family)
VSRGRLVRLALAGVLLAVPAYRVTQLHSGGTEPVERIAFVYDPAALGRAGFVRDAYAAVLQEEGIPHEWLPAADFVLLEGRETARRFRAVVFPDGLVQGVGTGIRDRAREYLEAGGDIAVVFDAGIREPSGAYRAGGLLAELVGVEYLLYRALGDQSYRQGSVRFDDPAAARYWRIPAGKLYQGQVVAGYAYGGLVYPMAAARPIARDLEVFAADRSTPVLSLRRHGRGRALWVNLPLGYLKAYGDDLLLRQVLRTFVFDVVELPHLVPAPGGVGGLVINWHLDSRIEMDGIPALLEHGLVRPGIRQDFHVTAGPDRDRPGDGLGFEACGRGEALLRRLAPHGAIGSHGGWAHNAFSQALVEKRLSRAEIRELIRRNNDCLARVAGRPIRAYAAPNGVHPQPTVTSVLEELGIRAYYYTGDTGAPPNRTFFDGRMVSDRVWAFPVTPNGRHAAVGEMVEQGLSAPEIDRWLQSLLDYVVEERTIRLMYSHGYDMLVPSSRAAFRRFVDRAEALQREGRLTVETMEHFVEFLDRLLRTDYTFARAGGSLAVTLANPAGLRGVAFAVPAGWLGERPATPDGLEHRGEGGRYHVYAVRTDATRLDVRLPLAGRRP